MESSINLQLGQKIVHGKYTACHQIGTGTYSSVYSISLHKKGRLIIRAIKVEHDKVTYPQISTEISVLKSIEGAANADIGFSKLFEYGFEDDYNYVVMQQLGPNLQQFLKLSGGKFSMKTVLILGLQMIDRIQVLHNSGFIYKDIKPQNFLMGIQSKSHILHLIDFGKCKRYRNKQTGKHIPYKQNTKFDGQYQFSGINTHSGTQYSRRDDMEALIYLMIYLRKGKLPWTLSKEFKTKKQKETTIEEIKKKLPVEHLTYKMPLTFVDLLYYIRTLNYYQKPDYDYIRTLLHRAFIAEEDNLSMVFDWNKMDQLDFAIYGGQPKIVLRNQIPKKDVDTQQSEVSQDKNKIRQSNSLDAQLMLQKSQKPSKKDSIRQTQLQKKTSQQEQSLLGKQSKISESGNPMDLFLKFS